MLKPAGSARKPNPDLMPRASRLAPTLRATTSASASTASASTPWTSQPRRRRARRAARRAASPTGAASGAATAARCALADRRRVHQAAFGPEVVDAARQPDRRLRPEVALEALAVVADLLDDAVRPLLVETEELPGVLGDAEETLDVGILGARLLRIDVALRQAVLLGLEHREQRPADDLEPLVVAAPHRRTERLLRDHLGQDDVVVGLRRLRASAGEVAHVGRVDLATAGKERARDRLGSVEDDRLVLHVVRAEVVGDVLLARRPGLHADGRAVHLLGARDAQLLRDHEALAVVVVDAGEDDPERRVARQRPGAVAREDVDLARLQRSEALLRVERNELDLVGVVQDRGGDRLAEIDVEAGPLALAVGVREARPGGVDSAHDLAARLDGPGRGGRGREGERGGKDVGDLHGGSRESDGGGGQCSDAPQASRLAALRPRAVANGCKAGAFRRGGIPMSSQDNKSGARKASRTA